MNLNKIYYYSGLAVLLEIRLNQVRIFFIFRYMVNYFIKIYKFSLFVYQIKETLWIRVRLNYLMNFNYRLYQDKHLTLKIKIYNVPIQFHVYYFIVIYTDRKCLKPFWKELSLRFVWIKSSLLITLFVKTLIKIFRFLKLSSTIYFELFI